MWIVVEDKLRYEIVGIVGAWSGMAQWRRVGKHEAFVLICASVDVYIACGGKIFDCQSKVTTAI